LATTLNAGVGGLESDGGGVPPPAADVAAGGGTHLHLRYFFFEAGEGMLDGVAEEKMKAVGKLRRERGGEMGVERPVFFDGPDFGAGGEQGAGECAEARADFDDDVAGTIAASSRDLRTMLRRRENFGRGNVSANGPSCASRSRVAVGESGMVQRGARPSSTS